MHTIAIIGGGFSGTMTALNLLKLDRPSPGRVLLFERTGRFGPGIAYSTRALSHSLNVPAGNMSSWDEDPQHFLRWVHTRNPAVVGGSFVPRAWYGDYLREQLEEATHKHRGRLELRGVGVTALTPADEHRFTVVSADGASTVVDRVVLALGNFPQPHPPGLGQDLLSHPGYIADPWRTDAVSTILPDEPVLCVGSGLTMMDVVMQLHTRGHAGRITALSRRGLMPRPHRSPSRPPTSKAPPDLASWDGSAKGLLQLIRATVRTEAAHGGDWRDVIASLRPVTSDLWNRLDDRERRRFLERLRCHWEVVRHRAAPETAAAIADLIAARQLQVRAGRILRIRPFERQFEVAFRPRRSENEQRLRVSRIINCLGPETDVGRIDDPLVRRLLSDGLITPDPHGLGLVTSAVGEAIGRDGQPRASLLVIGPLRKGQHWENTAVPELRRQAAAIARACAASATAAAAP